MTNIVVVFPKIEDGKNVKNLLVRNGYTVVAVCTTGAQALHYADGFVNGVIICAYKLPDMMYSEIKAYMPKGFEMILLASASRTAECTDVVSVSMPFAVRDFLNTLEISIQTVLYQKRKMRQKPVERNEEEKQVINRAKTMLMQREHMTEAEAHRYLQKCSMESGSNLVETAHMLLAMMN